ncbi:MAG: response regulator [Sulfurimicrobium sp.]|nr:response regulator [Sulfurimicrobium sp.]MDO9188270.1 response regulator [Sulfurimicrobium sp.]MDP1704663.1 response regulator [Sulfurimicrobium sp.]MDP2200016.1 response regulator [Sulfurimicrobium sp.]
MKQNHHILLVEDDPFLRNLLGTQLTEHGYHVTSAENGMQALESIEAKRVDVVITDIFMPDLDGIELIQRLRKNHPGTLIFALSGGTPRTSSKDYLTFAKCFGANEVFSKPVEMADLISKLELHCRRGPENAT